jgi:ATP-dependent helicase/nuclease subunit B
MPSSLPRLHHGSYRDLSAALAEQIATERNARAPKLGDWLASPVEILVSSSGAASAITAALLERFPAGLSGIRLRTLERFAEEIFSAVEEPVHVASTDRRTLAMTAAAHLARSSEDLLFRSRGLVPMLERSWRDIADSGVVFEELQRNVRRHSEPERFALVLEIWKRYRELLGATRSVEPDRILRRAAEAIRSGKGTIAPQILFGFYDATGLQLGMVRALAERGLLESIHVPLDVESVSPEGPLRFAQRFILELPPVSESTAAGPGPRPPARHTVARFRNREEELRQTVRSVASLLKGGVDPREIGVTRRNLDERDVALLQRHARDFGFAFTLQAELPLHGHRFARGILLLLGLREHRFRRGDVIEILGSGLSPSLFATAPRLSRLDELTRRMAIVSGDADELQRLQERPLTESQQESLAEYLGVLRKLAEIAPTRALTTAAEWSQQLRQLAGHFEMRLPEDVAAVTAVEEIAQELVALGGETFSAAEIADLIQQKSMTAEGAPGSVWLGDVMRLRGRSLRHLFVLSLEDDVFPQQRSDDPILPDTIRNEFGVRRIGDGEDEEELLFALTLAAASEEVHLSFAAGDIGGRVRRPSRLLVEFCMAAYPDLAGEIVADLSGFISRTWGEPPTVDAPYESEAARLIAGEDHEARRSLLLAARAASRSHYDGYLTLDDSLRQFLGDRLSRTSPSRFEEFGDCPQKFFLKTVIGVDDIEDPEHEIEMEVRKKGSLQHAILERFYRELPAERIAGAVGGVPPRLTSDAAALLERCISEAFAGYDAEFPPVNPAVRRVEQKRLRFLLQRFVVYDLQLLASDGFVPKHFEFRFGRHDDDSSAQAIPVQIGEQQILVRGSIDRIDVRESDGAHRIIDYKSGGAVARRDLGDKVDEGRALQLPLYALAIKEIFGLTPEQIEARIRPLGAPREVDKFSFTLAEKEERLRETLSLFVGAIRAGAFPAFPGPWCNYCVVTAFCRTRHDADEALALRRFEQARALVEELARK